MIAELTNYKGEHLQVVSDNAEAVLAQDVHYWRLQCIGDTGVPVMIPVRIGPGPGFVEPLGYRVVGGVSYPVYEQSAWEKFFARAKAHLTEKYGYREVVKA